MAYRSCRRSDFEAFVSKHENRLYRTALAITGNISDAEDIVQEAFLRAYEKAPEFVSEEHEKASLLFIFYESKGNNRTILLSFPPELPGLLNPPEQPAQEELMRPPL